MIVDDYYHPRLEEIFYDLLSKHPLLSFATDYLPTVIDDLSCYLNSYLTIFQCSYSTFISSSCNDDQDVSVTCCKFISCSLMLQLLKELFLELF